MYIFLISPFFYRAKILENAVRHSIGQTSLLAVRRLICLYFSINHPKQKQYTLEIQKVRCFQ